MLIPTDKLVSRAVAADVLGVKSQTLAAWHSSGKYDLPAVHCGRCVRYRMSDLERFIESRTSTRSS